MNNEETLQFIEDYRSHECLWNVRSKSYTNKTKRNDACSELAKKYNTTEKGVRNKIKSLRSYFSKEHQKLSAKKSGAGTDSNYETTWFAYSSLMFILDSVTPKETKDSIHSNSTNNEGTLAEDEVRNKILFFLSLYRNKRVLIGMDKLQQWVCYIPMQDFSVDQRKYIF